MAYKCEVCRSHVQGHTTRTCPYPDARAKYRAALRDERAKLVRTYAALELEIADIDSRLEELGR